MKADPAQQQRLLDLQAVDTRLSQLAHKRAHLSEHEELRQLQAQAEDAEGHLVRAQTALGDVEREVAKAEKDVQAVRDRASRDRARLEAGTGTAKDLQALQHEVDSLDRRQSVLEDEQLEVMERAEAAQEEVTNAQQAHEDLTERVAAVTERRDQVLAEIEQEETQVRADREPITAEIDDALLALYDKITKQSGMGAAELSKRRCGGCQLELNTVELGRIKAADEDDVIRCEECRRILVRTAESGL